MFRNSWYGYNMHTPGYRTHEYYDAMTRSDEPWKWASLGTGVGGMIGGAALTLLVNPLVGFAVIGIGIVSSVVCGLVAAYKHNKELHHYIMEDRKRMADHVNAQDRSMGISDGKTMAETRKIEAETNVIENSTKCVNNNNASYSKETINSSKGRGVS